MEHVANDNKVERHKVGTFNVLHALTPESDPACLSTVEAPGLGDDVDPQDLRFGECLCQARSEESVAASHFKDSRSSHERS